MAFMATAIIEPTSETLAGKDQGVVRLGQLAELGDVLFRDPQLDRFLASGKLNGLGDFAQSFGRGLRNGQDGRRGAFRLVDLLLLLGLRGLDHLLFLAFRLVDGGVALAF